MAGLLEIEAARKEAEEKYYSDLSIQDNLNSEKSANDHRSEIASRKFERE
jgi:hypothetical protein